MQELRGVRQRRIPMNRRWFAAIILVGVFATTLGIAVPPAYACSCAAFNPAEMLQHHGAAFIGTLVDDGAESVDRSGIVRSDTLKTVHFEVERWVKGDFGPEISLQTAIDGASCGLEIPEGARAGIFIYEQDGKLATGLCSSMSAEVLEAALEPFPAFGEGPAHFLLAGGFAEGPLLALDDRGRPLGIVPGDSVNEDASFRSLFTWDRCPGRQLQVELYDWELLVRSLVDLSVVDTMSLVGHADHISFSDVSCRDEGASSVWLLGEEWIDGRSVGRLFDASDGMRPVMDLPLPRGSIGEDFGVLLDYEGRSVIAIRWADETVIPVHELEDTGADFASVTGAAVSPNGEHIAATVYRSSADGAVTTEVLLFSAPDFSTAAGTTVDGGGERIRWLDDARFELIVHTDRPGTVVLDTALEQLSADFSSGWNGWAAARAGTTAVTVDSGTISIRVDGGPPEDVVTLPLATWGPIIALETPVVPVELAVPGGIDTPLPATLTVDPTEADPDASASTTSTVAPGESDPSPAPVTSEAPQDSSESDDAAAPVATDGNDGTPLLIAIGVLLVAAAGVVVLRRTAARRSVGRSSDR